MIKHFDTTNSNTENHLLPIINKQFWCDLCQRQFRTSSAFYQHGKRLSHLKRAMKIPSSRCTTITNGKITNSIQRNKSLTTSIPLVQHSTTITHSSQIQIINPNSILIRKRRHEEKDLVRISYTCDRCSCQCWSIRNIRRHIRLHANVRPYSCNLCQLKFKSYSNLMKHWKTSRHQEKNKTNENNWTIDQQALEEQNKLINQILIIDDEYPVEKIDIRTKSSSSMDESNNLLEDLHIPDSRLIDGDASELALIDPSTFEELHKAAECLLNLQGVFYFGEDEHITEKSTPSTSI